MDKFFSPESVAVIGASRNETKVGYGLLKNLIDAGFEGAIYPVNPKAEEILGLECRPSASDIPGELDLAIITVPPGAVLSVIDDLGAKKVPAAVIITAGFKESGPEGARLESALLEKTSGYGMRIIGPNCLGIIDTHSRLNASFAAGTAREGNIAFFSQSGALCTAILDWSQNQHIGFSKFVSLGNKSDVDDVDLLTFLGNDDRTDVILGYLEGVRDGARFMEAAFETAKKKPVVIAKSGSTAAGARAASSHTGTLAGSEEAFRAAFAQSGIIRAESIQDLFDFATVFASKRRAGGGRVAVVTNAGGPGILAADAVEKSALTMADFTKETVAVLRKGLPETAALYNPVDVIGDADADRYRLALRAVAADPNVDMLLTILTPQAVTKPDEVAQAVRDAYAGVEKPFAVSFMGGPRVAAAIDAMSEDGLPDFEFPDRAVRALEAVHAFSQNAKREKETVERFHTDEAVVKRMLSEAAASGRLEISDAEARKIVSAYGFRTPKSSVATSGDEAASISDEIGYPVAMKIASPDILHKSDIGAVKVDIPDAKRARTAFREIINNSKDRMPDAHIWGVSVQEMIERGREVILGVSRDPQFGPLIMFGLGGVYVEVMKDVSFRIAPIGSRETDAMIREIRSFPLLRGVRGEKPVDLDALRESVLRLSQMVTDFPEIVEMDVNPLMLFPGKEGAVALDVRITVAEVKS